jgi:SAM-dependent methyltransferase
MRLADFVTEHLPPPPARVLEVGCGRGELTLALDAGGYDVTGIDPMAPMGPRFRRLLLEDLDADDGPFDAVVASRSLHHVGDLDLALDRVRELLAEGGVFVLDEFAWDRLDLRTADWFWRQRRTLAAAHGHDDPPATLDACCSEWSDEHVGLHGYAAMRAALDARFEERLFEWTPYLYRLLGSPVAAELEDGLIAAGAIQAIGFRWVGEASARPAR